MLLAHDTWQKRFIVILLFCLVYQSTGKYAATTIPHPFIENTVVAYNLVVIVIAGILFGRKTGVCVALLSSILGILIKETAVVTNLIPSETVSHAFTLYATVPHMIMGYGAGYLGENQKTLYGSFMLPIGHILNITFFTLGGLFTLSDLNTHFIQALAFEGLIGIIIINVSCTLFYISFPFIKNKW